MTRRVQSEKMYIFFLGTSMKQCSSMLFGDSSLWQSNFLTIFLFSSIPNEFHFMNSKLQTKKKNKFSFALSIHLTLMTTRLPSLSNISCNADAAKSWRKTLSLQQVVHHLVSKCQITTQLVSSFSLPNNAEQYPFC